MKAKSTTQEVSQKIGAELARLPGFGGARVELAGQGEALPRSVLRVRVSDHAERGQDLLLKHQEDYNGFRLYQQFLVPFQLNSPKEYGYIELDGRSYLVMDYIPHRPTPWQERDSHLRAAAWLVRKDRVCQEQMQAVRGLDCLGALPYFGLDYWLPLFEGWLRSAPEDGLAQAVWSCVNERRGQIQETIEALDAEGPQTIVHGDLSLDNTLFGLDGEFYVIDWTQPHISSVAQDLVSLYQSAPEELRGEILAAYRKENDFPEFDAMFARARVIRGIGYLSWLAEVMQEGEEIDPVEMGQVARSVLEGLGWG